MGFFLVAGGGGGGGGGSSSTLDAPVVHTIDNGALPETCVNGQCQEPHQSTATNIFA